MAKGCGMIAPNMATMLAFLTTDADVSAEEMTQILREASDATFNTLNGDGAPPPHHPARRSGPAAHPAPRRRRAPPHRHGDPARLRPPRPPGHGRVRRRRAQGL